MHFTTETESTEQLKETRILRAFRGSVVNILRQP